MNRFDTKDPSEKITLTFDFTSGLAVGETLSGTPTAMISVVLGTDPAPMAIMNGVASLDATSKMVFVPVQAGYADCDYLIKVVCVTSNATKVLALSSILSVRS